MMFCSGLNLNEPATFPSVVGDNYRAAKYSMRIDVSNHNDLPELANMVPHSFTAYVYYIQYGKDTLIEILDPGEKIGTLGIIIKIWDYSKRKSSFTLALDHVRRYHTNIDTIQFAIEDCRGVAKGLCDETIMEHKCDSVSYISDSDNTQYFVYFTDTLPNLVSHKLLYPDIKYLPSKLIRVAGDKKHIMNLEEVIYGKGAIDALLNLYNYKGYKPIPDEEWDNPPAEVKEFVDKLIRKKD